MTYNLLTPRNSKTFEGGLSSEFHGIGDASILNHWAAAHSLQITSILKIPKLALCVPAAILKQSPRGEWEHSKIISLNYGWRSDNLVHRRFYDSEDSFESTHRWICRFHCEPYLPKHRKFLSLHL